MDVENQENVKKLAVVAGVALGGYFLYKLSNGTSVSSSVKQTVEKPLEIVQEVADEVVKVGKKGLKYFTKGSPEAKAHMAKLRSKKKKKSPKKKSSKKSKKVPVTDQEIISANKLKGKKAEAVKSGKVFKKDLFTPDEKAKIKHHTENNLHVENYIDISKKINSDLLGKFEAVQRQQDKGDGLNAEDSKKSYNWYNKLMKELKSKTNEEEYKEIYGSL